MTDIELAWAAGLFEGEGTICINKPHKNHLGTLRCYVGNTDREIVEFFLEGWGGHLHEIKASGNRRVAWQWTVAATKATKFIKDILPYLHTKRVCQKAQLGLEFQDQKSLLGVRRTLEYRVKQFGYYERMKKLNVRGVH